MRRVVIPSALLLVVAIGCIQKPAETDDPPGKSARPPGDVSKLDALVLAEKPAKAISVRDAIARPEGENVVVTGRVPGGKLKPFNAAVATVVLMAPEDLDKEEIKSEFDCDDAAT